MANESEGDEGGDVAAPGWDAIDGALDALYPGQEPAHFGTTIKYALGGPDPLDGISVYRAGPPDHWHYVTYGFSELYVKESDDPDHSGYGFELTLRLVRHGEEEPPMFALGLLQRLARYVFESGRAFEAGHRMDLDGPMASGTDTALTAMCIAHDPELPPIETPHGRVEFLQLVGLTGDELAAAKAWRTDSFLALLATEAPRLVTDLRRRSLLLDAGFAARVAAGTAADRSKPRSGPS